MWGYWSQFRLSVGPEQLGVPGLDLQSCTVRLSLTEAFSSPIAAQLLQQSLQHQEGTKISLVLLRHRGDRHAGLVGPLLPQAAARLHGDRFALHQILHILLRGHRHGRVRGAGQGWSQGLQAPALDVCMTRFLSRSRLFQAHGEGEPEKKEVSELRSELWEKEMKLTDIRLEALNSAHQLEQLRETMHNMQVRRLQGGPGWLQPLCAHSPAAAPGCCSSPRAVPASPQLEVDLLKAENDRLKVAPGPSAVPGSVPGHVTSSSASSSPRRSLGLTLGHAFSPSLGDSGRG